MSVPRPVRVVGVGSSAGDDSVGWEVVRQVQRKIPWDPELRFHTLTGGQELLNILDGRGTLVLVDAMLSVLTPGAVERFEWPDRRLELCCPGSTHQCRPAEALLLAATLGLAPPRVIIWAVSGGGFLPCTGLSPAVADALPALVQRIVGELTDEVGYRFDPT